MKLRIPSLAMLAAVPLLPCSCASSWSSRPGDPASVTGYSSKAAWTSASFDTRGFPIFGYTYGRPVYGYTESGSAVFTLAQLAAGCCVPDWAPAPWYRGEASYPRGIRRVKAPATHPRDHRPAQRPAGGLNATIHRNPAAAFGWRTPGPLPIADVAPPGLRPDADRQASAGDDARDSLDEWQRELERQEQWERDRQRERDQHHRHACGHKHKDKDHDCKHHR